MTGHNEPNSDKFYAKNANISIRINLCTNEGTGDICSCVKMEKLPEVKCIEHNKVFGGSSRLKKKGSANTFQPMANCAAEDAHSFFNVIKN